MSETLDLGALEKLLPKPGQVIIEQELGPLVQALAPLISQQNALLREALGLVCHKGSCSSQKSRSPLFSPIGTQSCNCGLVALLAKVTNWEPTNEPER